LLRDTGHGWRIIDMGLVGTPLLTRALGDLYAAQGLAPAQAIRAFEAESRQIAAHPDDAR
ncbi:MAG: hypothetical protein D6693_08985, partial [Planctomycetota bacterium]